MTADVLPFEANGEPRLELPPPSYGDPKKVAKDSEHARKLRDWQNARITYTHPYRIRQCSNWRKADLFMQNEPWLIKSYGSDPTRTQHWTPLEFDAHDVGAIPTPRYDEFTGPIENEAARLGRPEYKPYVRPSGESPDIKTRTAAKLAEKILTQALEDMHWNEQEDQGELHMPLYGGWWAKSWFDYSWEKTTRIGVEGALRCPSCDFRMASAEIPYERAMGSGPTDLNPEAEVVPPLFPRPGIERVEPPDPMVEGAMPTFKTSVCLTCEDHEEQGMVDKPVLDETGNTMLDPAGQPVTRQAFGTKRVPGGPKLEPFTPVDEELQQKDFLGRDLGEDVPLGEWKIKTCMPDTIFLENLGIGVRLNEFQEITEVHVESLEWICNRYENGHQVKAESPRALMEYHQVAGERAIAYGSDGSGMTLFGNHARVKETHKKPWREEVKDAQGRGTGKYRMNRGRTLIIASDVVLFDGDYLMESKTNPGTTFPRVEYLYCPQRLRSGGGEHSGISESEGIFDACENIVEIKSQIQDARQTEGSPKWLVPRGVNFDYERGGNAGDVWIHDPIPESNVKPERIPSELINSEIFTELSSDTDYIARRTRLNDVESGNVPAGITAALALQILAEQSGEVRRPRIRRIREMLQRLYRHGLVLMHELVREPRKYWEKDDRNDWTEKCWTGADMMGQTDVRIDAEPEHDSDVQQKQIVTDSVDKGLIDLQNPRMRRLTAKKTGLPAEIYEDEDLQEESAEREFQELMDEDVPPVVDMDLDYHMAHNQRHGLDMHSEKWRELEKDAGWGTVELLLWGWQEAFDMQPGAPVPMLDPATGQPVIDPATGQPATAPGPETPGLEQHVRETMPTIKAMELIILEAWKLILQEAGYVVPPHQAKALQKVLRMRAHNSAHKRLQQQEAMQAQAGAPVVAAPEATAPAPAMVQ